MVYFFAGWWYNHRKTIGKLWDTGGKIDKKDRHKYIS